MRKIFTSPKLFLLLIALLWCGARANAQVAAGDIVFTGFDTKGAAGTDFFTFVVITPLPAGTTINFTDRGYGGSSYNADNGTSETTIRWISGTSILPAGTEVKIMGLTTAILNENNTLPAGAVTALTGTAGLSLTGLDQVIAYTGTINVSATAIAGIHWNNCSGNTSTANWDIVGSCATVTGVSGSTMPPGLSNANGAIWAGLTGGVARICGRFKCPTTKYTTAALLKAAVLNNANWDFITSTAEPLAVGNSCSYLAAGPAISAAPSDVSICAASNTSFSITSATATSYKWFVKIGAANFTEISNSGIYSDATTATLKLTNVPATANGNLYRAEAINSGGTTTSEQAVLSVASGVPTIGANPSDVAICPGGSTILSASATGGSITYKWQVNTGSSFADITDGGAYSNSATGSLTITGATTSMYGYQYRLAATNACGTTYSNAAILTFRSTWTGTTSTNWNIAGNWSCNVVPDALTDVAIGTASNQPTVSSVANVRNIILNTGGTLTIAAANTLGLAGSITYSGGTLNATATNATVNFNSTTPNQPIAGGTYYNIQFTGSGNKVLTGDVMVNGSANILTNQLILLGNNTLTIGPSGSVSANASRYFVTNGTGGLKKMNMTSTSFVYPVGTATSYTPFLINNSGGTSDNFTGRVIDGVYPAYIGNVPQGSAITNKAVNKTYFVSEDVPGGSNAQMIIQWNQGDELPGFVRTYTSLSNYNNGTWNNATGSKASPSTGAGPYTQTRTGITSFGPFGVFMPLGPASVTSSTANGTYKAGDPISIQVTFSEVVTVTGTPQLTLETGTTDRTINYVSGSGTATLTFTYNVQAGDVSNDLEYAGINALALNGGTIVNAAGINATLTLPALGSTESLAGSKAIVIDAQAPAITSVSSSTANGTYKTGDPISIQVTFSENVSVAGTPLLTLETGSTDRTINYVSGSGTTTLTFTYNIQAGDNSADLDYASTTALALNGGTIRDANGNNATLILFSPGTAGSLGANKAIVIDAVAPTVVISSSAGTSGSSVGTAPIAFTATFSETVTDFSALDISVTNGTVTSGPNGSGTTYTFSVTPTTPGTATTVSIAASVALDAAGNPNTASNSYSLTYQVTLPVELVSFTARPEGNVVKLNWTTTSESNNGGFIIQRSADGANFSTLGSINGNGTTSTARSYVFHDRSPIPGTSYYKLVQIDNDGRPTEIGIKDVVFGLQDGASLYPNPATSTVTVRFSSNTSKIELIDLNGRVINVINSGNRTATHEFNVSGLPAGTYFIRLYTEAGIRVLRFVKL